MCSGVYIRCEFGKGQTKFCPSGLKFDPTINACRDASVVSHCPQPNKPENPTEPPTEAPSGINLEHIYQTKILKIFVAGFCAGKDNGDFASALCSDVYVTCSYGRSLVRQCSQGLKFSPVTGRCVHPSNVAACNAQSEPPPVDPGNLTLDKP